MSGVSDIVGGEEVETPVEGEVEESVEDKDVEETKVEVTVDDDGIVTTSGDEDEMKRLYTIGSRFTGKCGKCGRYLNNKLVIVEGKVCSRCD